MLGEMLGLGQVTGFVIYWLLMIRDVLIIRVKRFVIFFEMVYIVQDLKNIGMTLRVVKGFVLVVHFILEVARVNFLYVFMISN